MVLVACWLVPLAACVQIPESSPVREGREVGVGQQPPLISNVPEGPATGATPEDIVAGYLAAMLAYPRADSVVREFLSPTAADEWSPEDALVVYEDQELSARDSIVYVRGTALGTLDDRGVWTSTRPGERAIEQKLRLVRVDGEWRIANPPPGSYVDRDYFRRYYDPFSLFFYDPAKQVLVPDPVYLLVGDTVATALVRELTQGPTDRLAGVVTSAVPPATQVNVSVSTGPSGVTEVPLSEQVLDLSGDDRLMLAAQLAWTLSPLPDIDELAITVAGNRLELPGISGPFSIDQFSSYDPAGLAASAQPFALRRGRLVSLDDQIAAPVAGPIGNTDTQARSAGVDPTATLGALVSADGRRVLVGGVLSGTQGVATWYDGGTDLLPPSWDLHKLLWLVDRTSRGAVLSVLDGRDRRVLSAPGITGRQVHGFALSRDGVRLAALVGEGRQQQIVVATIRRHPDRPMQLQVGPARPVLNADYSLTELTDVAWSSPVDLAVLGTDPTSGRQVYEVAVDGSVFVPVTGFLPARPVSVAGGPNADAPLVIGGADGRLYFQTPDLEWVPVGAGQLYQPLYPG
jgi:hypothetical protein